MFFVTKSNLIITVTLSICNALIFFVCNCFHLIFSYQLSTLWCLCYIWFNVVKLILLFILVYFVTWMASFVYLTLFIAHCTLCLEKLIYQHKFFNCIWEDFFSAQIKCRRYFMLTWNQTNIVADIPSGHKARAILKLFICWSCISPIPCAWMGLCRKQSHVIWEEQKQISQDSV